MKKLVPCTFLPILFALLLWSCSKDSATQPKALPKDRLPRLYVVLSSSTAQGTGAGSYDSSWVGRCATYLRSATQSHKPDSIINLAVGGYTSYDILPTGNSAHNITRALSFHPYGIIINMPTNDIANGKGVDSQMQNFAAVAELIKQQKVQLWITTSQPRNLIGDLRTQLMELRDRINTVYGDRAIDFWSGIANPDGTINPYYGQGDGIHLNRLGHNVLFHRMITKKVFEN